MKPAVLNSTSVSLPFLILFPIKVSNWFANARRRLKNVVQEPRCSWSKRLRLYNQFVQGNAELLSISSNDSIWNSDDEIDPGKKFIYLYVIFMFSIQINRIIFILLNSCYTF